MTSENRPEKILRPSADPRTALVIWILFLSCVLLIVEIVANFNMGYRQFKIEMAEHWVDYQPDVSSPSPSNPNRDLSAASTERIYNTIARTLNDVSVTITGGRILNGEPDQVHGSGVLVAERYVITNYHVIENATDLNVTVYGPVKTVSRGQVVLTDQVNDLALLKLDTNASLPSATLGNSDTVGIGDMVFAMGNAFGAGNIFTTGVISGRSRTFYAGGREYRNLITSETYVYPGSSGGPLADINGEIIGINTIIYNPQGQFTGISFAMPINRAMTLLRLANVSIDGASSPAAPAGYSLVA